ADDAPADIARKALRVNLSDLAAKGAEPFGYLLSIALPSSWTPAWMAGFARGLRADQRAFGVALLGGDTVRSPGALSLSITALGRAGRSGMIRRNGASANDRLYLTGTIGDAALGLRLRRGDLALNEVGHGAKALVGRYLRPQPRLSLVAALRSHATAAMDVSDGLVADLGHLCAASRVGARVDIGRVPLSAAARRWAGTNAARWRQLVSGGDDYEILAAVGPRKSAAFEKAAAVAGVAVSCIGEITGKGQGLKMTFGERPFYVRSSGGHTHF
ncbi:MAG: thiamine-phosphate kinase, partial [Alphaproteobacteria bacterium]